MVPVSFSSTNNLAVMCPDLIAASRRFLFRMKMKDGNSIIRQSKQFCKLRWFCPTFQRDLAGFQIVLHMKIYWLF